MSLCLFAWLVMGLLCPFSAHATPQVTDPYPVIVSPTMTTYNNQFFGYQICPIDTYNTSDPNQVLANLKQYGLVKRIVYCVQGLVIPATYKIMYHMAVNFFYAPIAAAMTLAVALWGVMLVMGKQTAVMRDGFVIALKIGSVSFFTYMLGQSSVWPHGLFPVLIAIIDELAAIVTSYVGYSSSMKCVVGIDPNDIWARMDCVLNTLVGAIFNPSMLLAGLLGFFVCALVSGAFGLFVALAGFAMIFILIFMILRATYITITAYVAIALMSIISPLFITMLLFKVTRGYFEKWAKLMIGFMLQPIFLFAYLAMVLAAFDTVVYDGKYSIYRAIVPPIDIGFYPAPMNAYPAQNPTTNPDGDFLIGNWLFDLGIYREADAAAVGVGTSPNLQKHIEAHSIGVLGSPSGDTPTKEDFKRKDSAGILMNVINSFAPRNIYKVDVPIRRISWQNLSLLHLCTMVGCNEDTKKQELSNAVCGYPQYVLCQAMNPAYDEALDNIMIDYLIQLILSLLLAFLTLYLFYLMLDLLPFIGAGMSESSTGIPHFGSGGNAMPGNKLLDKMKAGMGKLASGGAGGAG